jgi:hypothetical protein
MDANIKGKRTRDKMLGLLDETLLDGDIQQDKYWVSRSKNSIRAYNIETGKVILDTRGTQIKSISIDECDSVIFNVKEIAPDILIVHIWGRNKNISQLTRSSMGLLHNTINSYLTGYSDELNDDIGVHARISEAAVNACHKLVVEFERALLSINGKCVEISQYYSSGHVLIFDQILGQVDYDTSVDAFDLLRYVMRIPDGSVAFRSSRKFDYLGARGQTDIIWTRDYGSGARGHADLLVLKPIVPKKRGAKSLENDLDPFAMEELYRNDQLDFFHIETYATIMDLNLNIKKKALVRIYERNGDSAFTYVLDSATVPITRFLDVVMVREDDLDARGYSKWKPLQEYTKSTRKK